MIKCESYSAISGTLIRAGERVDIEQRTELARELLARGSSRSTWSSRPTSGPSRKTSPAHTSISPSPPGWPPAPGPLAPAPSPAGALPDADVVVVTWTIDEQNALADVLTPGFGRAR